MSATEAEPPKKELRGREALLEWCKACTKDYKFIEINDFDKSWSNGLALCAVISHFRPDLIGVSVDKLKDNSPEKNVNLALKATEQLGIPSLIDIADIIGQDKGVPNQYAMVTLLTQLYHHFSTNVQAPTPQVTESDNCRRCKKQLKGATILFQGKFHYHLNCFQCAQCGRQLSTKYVAIGNKPFCEGCGKVTWNETIRSKSAAKEHETKRQNLQITVFTNWINFHVAEYAKKNPSQFPTPESIPQVKNMKTDLSDGIALMLVMKEVYGDRVTIPNYIKHPKLRVQYLDNASGAVKMMEQAGYKTFLKPQNIVDGDIKMIMGLVWKLILDYRIAHLPQDDKSFKFSEDDAAKNSLLQWCRQKLADSGHENTKLTDFTTSFEDGQVLLKLIHSKKAAAVNLNSIDPTQKTKNLKLAFETAEREFGIPQLLGTLEDPPRLDERSMMTYLSEFVAKFDLPPEPKNVQTTPAPAPAVVEQNAVASNSAATSNSANASAAPTTASATQTGAAPSDSASTSSSNNNSETSSTSEEDELEDTILETEEVPLSDVDVFNWEDLKMDGWLQKQDTTFPWFWRKRYFSLRGTRLLYFKEKPNSDNTVPMGHISLAFAKQVEENKIANASGIFSDRKFIFMVVMNDRVYHLQAGVQAEMDQWINILQKACNVQKGFNKLQAQKIQGKNKTILSKLSSKELLKEGVLYELGLFKQWKKYYFVLKDGILFRHNNKGESQNQRIYLHGCKLHEYREEGAPTDEETTAFQLTASDGNAIILKAESWQEMHEWLNAILKQQYILEEFIASIKL